jgi:hypothetical protein
MADADWLAFCGATTLKEAKKAIVKVFERLETYDDALEFFGGTSLSTTLPPEVSRTDKIAGQQGKLFVERLVQMHMRKWNYDRRLRIVWDEIHAAVGRIRDVASASGIPMTEEEVLTFIEIHFARESQTLRLDCALAAGFGW